MKERCSTMAETVSLTAAEGRTAAPAKLTYTPVGESKKDGNATYVVVESSAAGKPLYLQVTRARKGKDDAIKRYPLAPVAAAVRLGVIQ
jgi:hypothetical protein